jgi:protein ImuB
MNLPPTPPQLPLWLAVTFPDLGLAVHTRALPRSTEPRPLALVHDSRVLHCNAEAAAQGVRPGQRTAAAVALCPPLRFLDWRPAQEAEHLQQLAEACIAVTPTVVLSAPRSLLLEVGGCLQLFHGLPGVLKQLRRSLRPFELEAHIAQAPTPKAALALAASPQAEASLKLPAPHGMRESLPLLREVPLACLPWSEAQQKKLDALHFHTLGELLALPRAAITRRLGTGATRYLAQLEGALPDPQQAITVPEDFQSTLPIPDGVTHVEGLRFPMKRLVEEFCRFLRQRQLSCERFTWRFTHEDRSRQQLVIASARGEPQAERFLKLTELKLEQLRIKAPVEAITLLATEFQPQADTRLALLPDPGAADDKAVALLDRLRARLGNDACQLVGEGNSHRPEQAQLFGEGEAGAALRDSKGRASKRAGKSTASAYGAGAASGPTRVREAAEATPASRPEGALPAENPEGISSAEQSATLPHGLEIDGQPSPTSRALRPIWLWPEPKQIRLIDGQLWWQGAFTLLTRPERIALPWWEDSDTRDYYLARHDNGAHYWIYFSGAQQAWFCHGVFG